MITEKSYSLNTRRKERIRRGSEWGGRIKVLVEVTDRRTQSLCWRSLNKATWQHFFVFCILLCYLIRCFNISTGFLINTMFCYYYYM